SDYPTAQSAVSDLREATSPPATCRLLSRASPASGHHYLRLRTGSPQQRRGQQEKAAVTPFWIRTGGQALLKDAGWRISVGLSSLCLSAYGQWPHPAVFFMDDRCRPRLAR